MRCLSRLETLGGDCRSVSTPPSPSLALKGTQRTPARLSSRSRGPRRWRGSESPAPTATSMAGGWWRWSWSAETTWDRSCWPINISHFCTGSGQRSGFPSMSDLTSKTWFRQQDQLTFRKANIKVTQNSCVSVCIHVQSLLQPFDVAIYPHSKLEIIPKISSANSLLVSFLQFLNIHAYLERTHCWMEICFCSESDPFDWDWFKANYLQN